MIARSLLLLLSAALLSTACSGHAKRSAEGTQAAAQTSASARPDSAEPMIVFLGTSLTAGPGLDPSQTYPALIQQKIDSAGLRYRVQNAGVSGETSAGARRRAEWLFQKVPQVLVIETGANDMLRGQSSDSAAANIQAIVDRAKELRPAPTIVLIGMQSLPNFGPDYARRFSNIYPRLARENGVALVPFLLAGVAGVDSLNQADGLHPTAQGHRIVAENVWKILGPVLEHRR